MTDTTEQPKTEAAAVANMALNAAGVVPVEIFELEGVTHAFTPKLDATGRVIGVQREVLPKRDQHGLLTDKPSRVAGAVTVETQDSLVDYVRDFKGTGTRLFASISSNAIVAVLDFHEGRTDGTADMGSVTTPVDQLHDYAVVPDFGQHTATLKLAYSEEWKVWTQNSERMMDQLTFARFIVENGPDIESPDAATFKELVRDLRATRTKRFTGDVNMAAVRDGFTYEDRTDLRTQGTLEVPDGFTLRLPVYFGGQLVAVQAQLRYDVTEEGALVLGYKLLRAESVRQAVFKELVADVGSRSGCPVVYGKRESLRPDGGADFL